MFDVVNPYIAGNPVTGSAMFFGREDVFQFIRQTLIGQHRDNVIVIYGQQRTGKTSVLYQMHSHLDANYLCIFIDLHGFALEGVSGFIWELANQIARVLHRDYQIDLPRLNQAEFVVEPRNFFENEFLNRIWSAIGNRHILLMIDEAIRLQEQVQAGKMERQIFEYMRHLMQHYERLNFLFSLGSGLEEMEKEYTFLFSVGLYKKISFLDRHSVISLITQPVRNYYQVKPDAMERIFEITSGHPYYTQLLCHSLFNRWQQQHLSYIEVEDVDEILNEVVERGLAVLKYVWSESTPGEKAIMVGIADAMGEANCSVEASSITDAWAIQNVVIPKGAIAKAIRSLIAREVIIGQDKYMFTVDLQRLWVQEYCRIEWVKEEIADTIREWLLMSKAESQEIHTYEVETWKKEDILAEHMTDESGSLQPLASTSTEIMSKTHDTNQDASVNKDASYPLPSLLINSNIKTRILALLSLFNAGFIKLLYQFVAVLLILIFFSFLGAVTFPGLQSTSSSLDAFVRAFLLLLFPGIIMGIIGHFLGIGIRGIENSFEKLGLTFISAFLNGSILAFLSLLNFAYSVHVNFNWVGTTWYAQVFTIFIIGAIISLVFTV